LANSVAELDGIGTVEITLVSTHRDRSFLGASVFSSSPHNINHSAGARSRASSGQTVRSLGDLGGLGGSQVSRETFATKSSTVNLFGGIGRVVNTSGIFAIEFVLSSDNSSDFNERVRNAVTTTITDFSTSYTISSAIFIGELSGVDLVSKESTSLSFSEVIRFSIVVVRNVPASTFKETESDFRDLGSDDTTSGHDFPLEESSFDMGTTIIFHKETRNSGAAIESLESLGERRKVKNSSGDAAEGDSLDMVGQSVTALINKVLVKRAIHAESMDKFMSQNVDIQIMLQRSGDDISSSNGISINTNVDNNWSLDTRRNGTKSGSSHPATSSIIL